MNTDLGTVLAGFVIVMVLSLILVIYIMWTP